MFVWHLPRNGRSHHVMDRVLGFAVALNRNLKRRLQDPSGAAEVPIGLGLAHGQAMRIKLGGTIDYVGYLPNLAAKLQDFARPSGLVVSGSYFRALANAGIKYPEVGRCFQLSASPLSNLRINECFISEEVEPAVSWTCLAWPGIAITEDSTKDGPTGLNTNGITVLTHEGLQGKIGTLQVWPRHVPVRSGDQFELIVDDFDALCDLHSRGSVHLVPALGADVDKVCRDLVKFERDHAQFLFVPIRCGLNALAVHPGVDLQKVLAATKQHYAGLKTLIKDGTLPHQRIGVYDNDGASFSVLLKLVFPNVPSEDIFDLDEQQLESAVKELIALAANGRRYNRKLWIA